MNRRHPVDSMYESMAVHPDCSKVLDLLHLVDPVDEFSAALCLVRDCFSPTSTLSALSRQKLAQITKERMDLLRAYQDAMVRAADGKAQTYRPALDIVSTAKQASQTQAYEDQGHDPMAR